MAAAVAGFVEVVSRPPDAGNRDEKSLTQLAAPPPGAAITLTCQRVLRRVPVSTPLSAGSTMVGSSSDVISRSQTSR